MNDQPIAKVERYFLVGPGNQTIVVTREFYETFARFLKPQKTGGDVTVRMRNGGVAGITLTEHVPVGIVNK